MEEEKKQIKGLSDEQVKASRAKYGHNVLTPPDRESVWKLLLEKFEDPIIRVLLIAAFLSLGISFIEKEFAETIGIFAAIFLATGVAFWFEYDAQRKFDLLGTVDDDNPCKVIRNGHLRQIPKKDIVVGDIVVLETGEEIPADGRLMESVSLSVNESNLTGEPVIEKSVHKEHYIPDATYPSYMLMRGTTIVEGHGTITVTAVGDSTEYGKVARQATIKPTEKTPLTIQLEKLARFIGVIGFGLAAALFVVLFLKGALSPGNTYETSQWVLLLISMLSVVIMLTKVWVPIFFDGLHLVGYKKHTPAFVSYWGWLRWIILGALFFIIACAAVYFFLDISPLETEAWITLDEANKILSYFMVAVTLIVVAVPEGLPMSVTLSLALSMRRMLKTNNLVRNMHACETMGAATVICTDKTGTLTQNMMSVSETSFYSLADQKLSDDAASRLVKEGIAVNSTAFLERDDSGACKPVGNPTEGALLLWLDSQGVDFEPIREKIKVVDQLTFTTERKFMATLADDGDKNILYIKGAPEIVFAMCGTVLADGREAPASEYKEEVESRLLSYQNRAMRTLAFAYAYVDKEISDCGKAVEASTPVFLGELGIMDPVRPDVPDAIKKCLDAGIDIKIVTGDTPATAREIARQIGLWTVNDSDINQITGVDFAEKSDEELLQIIPGLKIMARARPTDKQRLVQLLQRLGEVVAVTGDGTNDAPALNFAQVGLSMGTGTSVAKEASDITLLDDSFNSIATAVMWGRSLYKNIQRFVMFQLTINLTAIIVVFFGSIFGAELPLTVTQMLWVNLIMDTFAAAALASLPPDPKVMEDKPRRTGDFIITPKMTTNILVTGLLFVAALMGMLLYLGDGVTIYQLTVFFTVFVALQFWNMFNAKAFGSNKSALSGIIKCPAFILVLLLILLGQILIVNYAGSVFRTEPLAFMDWLKIIGATSVVLWIGEAVRSFQRIKKKIG